MHRRSLIALSAGGLVAAATPLRAAITKSSKRLPELILGDEKGNDFAVSQADFELEAGQGYRWPITAKGSKEYAFMAPGFFRNVWMNQIVVDDLEVHMAEVPDHLEFDAPGTFMVQFTTVRPGEYEWWVDGLAEKGMKGKIVIK